MDAENHSIERPDGSLDCTECGQDVRWCLCDRRCPICLEWGDRCQDPDAHQPEVYLRGFLPDLED